MKTLLEMGIQVPDILLPKNVDTSTWAVVACDQHTSDRSYWQKVQEIVDGPAPKRSTLHLMLPEVYLDDSGKDERIKAIHLSQRRYLDEGIFEAHRGFVYVERSFGGCSASTAGGEQAHFDTLNAPHFDTLNEPSLGGCRDRCRKGLIASIDLEKYDWHPETRALIRATEATIPERIPPRVAIRKGAALDMPHIMLLVNDKDGILVEAEGRRVHEAGIAPLYDGELMLGGGHITGYLADEADEAAIAAALNTLYKGAKQADASTFLFAVGDGNHSLATAKAVWDEYKASIPKASWKDCPIRYALAEIINLYDEAMVFEPIHRVLFDVNPIDLLATIVAALNADIKEMQTPEEMLDAVNKGKNAFGVATGGRCAVVFAGAKDEALSAAETASFGRCLASKPAMADTPYRLDGADPCSSNENALPVAQIQDVLDDYIREGKGRIDYIHGDHEAISFGGSETPSNVAILLPPISKDGLFQTIVKKGSMPRKSFSMGEANEKRYYMECRRLF